MTIKEELTSQLSSDYFTVQELTELFHVTRRTVYGWMSKGYLVGTKAGKRYLFTPGEVQDLKEILSARNRDLHALQVARAKGNNGGFYVR